MITKKLTENLLLKPLKSTKFSVTNLKGIDWIIQEAIAVPITCWYPEISFVEGLKRFGFGCKILISYYDKAGLGVWIFDREQLLEGAKKLINDEINNKETYGASSEVFFVPQKVMGFHSRSKLRGIQPSWNKPSLQNIYQYWLRAEKKFYQIYQNIYGRIDRLSELSDRDLWKKFIDFSCAYINEYSPALVTEYPSAFGDILLDKIKQKNPTLLPLAQELIIPKKKTFCFEQEEDLLKIAVSKTDVKEKLQSHQKKYYWIYNNYRDVDPLPVSFFQTELNKIIRRGKADEELREKRNKLKILQNRQKAIIGSKVFDNDTLVALKMISFCAAWQDRRKKCNLIANYLICRFIKEISRRKNIDYQLLRYALPHEIKQIFLDNDLSILKKIRTRHHNGYFRIAVPGKEYISTVSKNKKIILSLIRQPKSDEITGITGSPGITQGKVKIIMDPKNYKNFKQGEILITGMTRPDFIPLMKRASAVVTNEGGLTSHAAIISRELGIPCVIGTKIATKIFKDGDRVEVDANKGVVKKIERKLNVVRKS